MFCFPFLQLHPQASIASLQGLETTLMPEVFCQMASSIASLQGLETFQRSGFPLLSRPSIASLQGLETIPFPFEG